MGLAELKAAVLADGVIDKDEVGKIRTEVFADGKIDREEADFLFDLNDAVTGKANDEGWPLLFAEAIASHVLDDDSSPGVVDDDEAAWLAAKIEGDGTIDEAEKQALRAIQTKAKDPVPAALKALFDKI